MSLFLAVSAALFSVEVRLSHGSNISVLPERCEMPGAVHASLCLRCDARDKYLTNPEKMKLNNIVRQQR